MAVIDGVATVLVDGGPVQWALRPRDQMAVTLANALQSAMGGRPPAAPRSVDLSCGSSATWPDAAAEMLRAADGDAPIHSRLPSYDDEPDAIGIGLAWVSSALAEVAVARSHSPAGCGLYHGALATLAGTGVMLAAPGGTGKSTASARLPAPWRSLSDDTCFVARADDGGWRAHPWPTWSQFMHGGAGGRWAVGEHVPLSAVFFLEQAETDSAERLGQGETTARLYTAAEQARGLVLRALGPDERQAMRARWFAGAAQLAKGLRGYRLRLTLHGRFWELVEAELHRTEEGVAR